MKDETKFWIGLGVLIVLFIAGMLYQESDYRPVNVTVLDKHNVTEIWEAENDTYAKNYMAVKCLNMENGNEEYYITSQDRWNDFPIGLNCTIGQGNLQ